MWKKSESIEKPLEVDTVSSSTVCYVRKDITFVEAVEIEGMEKPAHWEYLEQTIPAADWGIYESVIRNASNINDVSDALIELAEMIVG